MIKDKILELRKQELSINEITKIIGCAKSTVSYHLNKNNLGGRIDNLNYDNKFTDIDRIIKLRKSGKTYDEIRKIINVSKDRLKKICRDNNLNNPVNTQVVKLNKVEVTEYYKKVKSLKAVGKYFNVSKDTIRKFIDDSDIMKGGNRQNKIKTNSQAVIEWRKRRKFELVKYKGGKCEICGYSKSMTALQFHHTNPNEKDFTLSRKTYSMKKLLKEVDKCMLVCANCHAEIHENLKSTCGSKAEQLSIKQ